ncbi:MAG: Unknown protein [uncultured Aureispira sp.]|uniref:Lipoprotein n=1 Tax=uncultured Aureispira sp. TaxID=1331704 RepID=A0A6S6SUH3_9BACT|nr:MAG: Unknown protein [uncultured Aureispira sp.]
MKKLILSCAVAVTAAVCFSSCAKDSCYECEQTASSVETVISVCEETITTTTTSGGSTSEASVELGNTNKTTYRESLEAAGYTCVNK